MHVPFNVVDETIRVLDRPHEPWTIQIEARAACALDAQRLRAAVGSALGLHPMARARQVPWSPGQWGYAWEITPGTDIDPLHVVDGRGDAALSWARAALYSDPIPLQRSPPLRMRLVHHPGGDFLLLGVNHAAADGLGSLRILTSVLRAYAGASDPVPDVDPLGVRALQAPLSLGGVPGRLRNLAAFLAELAQPKARVAADAGIQRAGYGFHHVRLTVDDTAALGTRRRRGATVNDVLVAALHLTIADWNAEHDRPCERIGVMVPVNLRPRDRLREVVGNFSSFVSVLTAGEDRRDPEAALAAVTAQTRRIRERGVHMAMIDVLSGPIPPPVWFRRLAAAVLRAGAERGVDTAVLSNLGRLDEVLSSTGDIGHAVEVWFSPPACMPLGLAVGAVTTNGSLHLAFRYRHAVFAPEAAGRFAAHYTEILRRLA